MKKILERLSAGRDLTFEEAQEVFDSFLDGHASDIEMAGVLTALRMKGESADEIAGAASALRARTMQTELDGPVVDTCGTGGDGSGSFNISTAAAIVAAGAGIHVAKHGNRSVTSRSGSSDVLEALGVSVEMSEAEAARTLQQNGIGFFHAPAIHTSMRTVAAVRRTLGFRTIFNMIGPLCNPIRLSGQLIGVGDKQRISVMADAALRLGLQRVMLVCSDSGMDELTLSGENEAIFIDGGKATPFKIEAKALGLEEAPDSALRGGSAAENAKIMMSVLKNEASPYREAVRLNAAAVLYAGGLAASVEEGLLMATGALENGRALEKLNRLKAVKRQQQALEGKA